MYILPLMQSDNVSTQKYRDGHNIKVKYSVNDSKKQINLFLNDNRKQKNLLGLSIIAGLSVLAVSILFKFLQKKSADKNVKKVDINKDTDKLKVEKLKTADANEDIVKADMDFSKLLADKPERNKFIAITSFFPKLHEKYQVILADSLNKPEDNNKFVLNFLENTFTMLSSDDGLRYRKAYFEALDNYSDCLEDVAKNMSSAISNGESPMHYMVLLRNGKISKEEIQQWARYNNLSCDEYMLLRNYNETIIHNINSLKQINNNFKITHFETMPNTKYMTNYVFKLDFPEGMSLEERLKTITDVHRAIYGEIYVKGTKDREKKFLKSDIQTELLDSIVKDSQMDAVYNFVKFINPEALKDINLTSDEVKSIDNEGDLYKQIQSICTKEVVNLNFDTPKMQEMIELMGNNDIFGEIFSTRHSRIRFITRFVLKDNPNADLVKVCQEKIDILKEEMDATLNKCNYFCYSNKIGTAPQFYLRSTLGTYVKLTLNNKGTIHTIFEDFKKIKDKKPE